MVCLEHVRPFFTSTESQEFIFAIARGEGGGIEKSMFLKKKNLTLPPVVHLEHVRPFFVCTKSQEFISDIDRGGE